MAWSEQKEKAEILELELSQARTARQPDKENILLFKYVSPDATAKYSNVAGGRALIPKNAFGWRTLWHLVFQRVRSLTLKQRQGARAKRGWAAGFFGGFHLFPE